MCHPSGLVLVEAVSALCSFLVRVRLSGGTLGYRCSQKGGRLYYGTSDTAPFTFRL